MTNNEVIRLEQLVPLGGFKWVNGKTETLDTQFLVPIDDSAFEGVRTYNPVENKALFRVFADTDPTQDGVLKFANQFGLLGGSLIPFTETDSGKFHWFSDPIENWQQEIAAMRPVIMLWDAIEGRDISTIREHLQWADKQTLNTPTPNVILHFGAIPLTRGPETRINVKLVPGQESENTTLVAAAIQYIEHIVNKHLKSSIKLATQDGQLRLRIEAGGLQDVLWLQCAQAISQRRIFRECRQCGTWFEPYSAKTKKAFCSTACRLKHYRGRITEAQQLHEQGKSPADIANILGTDTKTVRGWIKGGSK